MAVGAESFRRNNDPGQATSMAIKATQDLMESFVNRTSSIECEDITNCDFTDKKSFRKYMLRGKFLNCFKLTGKWAPEALEAAKKGLVLDRDSLPKKSLSCASEVVRKMGGDEEEMLMVAGFAGGLGLSGSGCGALAAAVWKNALIHNKKNTGKSANYDPNTDFTLKAFYEETDYEMQCDKICGRRFETMEEHTEFLKNGGCKKLMEVLADTMNQE